MRNNYDFENSAPDRTILPPNILKNPPKWVLWIGIAFIIGILGYPLKPFTIVDSGKRGLKFTTGKLNNEVLPEGLNWKIPLFQKIKQVTIQPIQKDHQVVVGPDGAITKDNQNIGANITLFYKYKQEQLASMWRDLGEQGFANIAVKSMETGFKQAVGKNTIFDIAPIQKEIEAEVFNYLKLDLAKHPVELTGFKISNYDWPDSFEKAIEETMKKAQQVKQEAQNLLVLEQQAQKQVKQANASKQAMITVAEGEKLAAALRAEAKALEGEGIRKYNESIAKNMDQEIQFRKLEIDKIIAQRWNGQNVATNNYGPIPISSTEGIKGMVSQPDAAK